MKPNVPMYLLLSAIFSVPLSTVAAGIGQDSACAELKTDQARLDNSYKELRAKHASDRAFIEKLESSRWTWTAYRDAQVALIFPHGPGPEYGSAYAPCTCQLLDDLTRERIRFLDQWATGIEEGDVCTGSRPIKR